ncbi:tetratricopeptide repeat protein [bacterium]|nr:tetratricopeptide repeat protein [bacterium]
MKKGFILFLLVIGLLVCGNNCTFAESLPKVSAIAEIGTLTINNNLEQALEKCNKALEEYPDNSELYYWRASIKGKMNNNKEALADYNKAVELEPGDPDLYVMRGICKSDLDDREGAIADFNKALELNPKNSSAYSMRACVKLDMGDFEGATKDLEMANSLFDNDEKSFKPAVQ